MSDTLDREGQLDGLIEASHALTHLLVEIGRSRGRAQVLEMLDASPELEQLEGEALAWEAKAFALADNLCLAMAAVARNEEETFEYLRSLLEGLR